METIATTKGQNKLSSKLSMALIASSGGNTAVFLPEHAGRRGVFHENAKDNEEEHHLEGGGGTQANTCGQKRSRQTSPTRLLKINNIKGIVLVGMPRHGRRQPSRVTLRKLEGSLTFVEEKNVLLEDISALVDMYKLKVGCLEVLIHYKGQMP